MPYSCYDQFHLLTYLPIHWNQANISRSKSWGFPEFHQGSCQKSFSLESLRRKYVKVSLSSFDNQNISKLCLYSLYLISLQGVSFIIYSNFQEIFHFNYLGGINEYFETEVCTDFIENSINSASIIVYEQSICFFFISFIFRLKSVKRSLASCILSF